MENGIGRTVSKISLKLMQRIALRIISARITEIYTALKLNLHFLNERHTVIEKKPINSFSASEKIYLYACRVVYFSNVNNTV